MSVLAATLNFSLQYRARIRRMEEDRCDVQARRRKNYSGRPDHEYCHAT